MVYFDFLAVRFCSVLLRAVYFAGDSRRDEPGGWLIFLLLFFRRLVFVLLILL